MWFGDVEGILRYDGIEYSLFQERHGLPGAPILSICDTGGFKYFGTPNGLARFSNNQASKLESIPTAPIRVLISGDDDELWIGSGVGLFLLKNGLSTTVLPDEDIRSICIFKGRLLVGTNKGDLISIANPGQPKLRVIETLQNLGGPVRGLISTGGELYAGSTRGLFKIENEKAQFIELLGAEEVGISTIIPDKGGRIWIGSWGQGVFNYDPSEKKTIHMDTQSGIPSPFVTSILLDEECSLWVSFFNGGVVKLADTTFQHFPVSGGTSITRMNIDSEDTKWFTSTEYGLMRMERGSDKAVITSEITRDAPTYNLFIDSKDRVWVIQPEHILRTARNSLGEFETDILKPSNQGQGAFRWMFEDSSERMWLGGTRGLARIEQDQILDVTPKGDTRNTYWHCIEQADKSLVFSSMGKLWVFRDNQFAEIPFDKGKEYEIQSLLIAEQGSLLVGTSQGLFRVSSSSLVTEYEETRGFNISKLYRDSTDRIWAGSRNGIWEVTQTHTILKYQPEKTMGRIENIIQDSSGTLWFIAHNLNILFDEAHWMEVLFPTGLAIQAFNPIPTDSQGITWFATNQGLTSYNPQNLDKEKQLPFIRTCFLAFPNGDRTSVTHGETLFLQPNQSNFILHFQSNSFINEKLNRYKIEVEGSLSESRKQEATEREFMNLVAGEYHISITPYNGLNQGSTTPFQFTLIMKTPLWKRTSSIVIFVFLLAMLVYAVGKYINYRNIKSLEDRNIWLEKELKEKTASLLDAKKIETASALTVTLSDEISQPLMAIQGNIDLLKHQPDHEIRKGSTQISNIQSSIDRIRNVIRKLRELDGIQFNEYTPGIRMVNLKPEKQDAEKPGPKRILFVDDEEDLLEIWKMYFETLGYQVFIATGVEEALKLIAGLSNPIDLIVSDNKMPGKTGFDFFIETRNLHLETPFFILTGFDVEPQLKEMLKKGLQGIIQKPIMLDTLHDIIRPYLQSDSLLQP